MSVLLEVPISGLASGNENTPCKTGAHCESEPISWRSDEGQDGKSTVTVSCPPFGSFSGVIDGVLEVARIVEGRGSLHFVALWSSKNGYRWGTAEISNSVKNKDLGLQGRCTPVRLPSGRARLFSILTDREAVVVMHGDSVWVISPDKDPVQLYGKSAVKRLLSFVPTLRGGGGEIQDVTSVQWAGATYVGVVSARNVVTVWRVETNTVVAELDITEHLHTRAGMDDLMRNQCVRLRGTSRDTLLASVHVGVGATSQFIVLRGYLAEQGGLELELETKRFHDGQGRLMDSALTPHGIWAAWESEAAYAPFDSVGLGGVQWLVVHGAGSLAGLAAGDGESALVAHSNGELGLVVVADCIAALGVGGGDDLNASVLGTVLSRGAADVRALSKAIQAARAAVSGETRAALEAEIRAGGCASAACRRAVADGSPLPNDLASDLDDMVVALVNALEALEAAPDINPTRRGPVRRGRVAIEASHIVHVYRTFVTDVILSAHLIASQPTVARATVQQIALHVVPRAARALRVLDSLAPVATPAAMAAVIESLGNDIAGLGSLELVTLLCARNGVLEDAVHRGCTAALTDVLRGAAPQRGDAAKAYLLGRGYMAQGQPEKAVDWIMRGAGTIASQPPGVDGGLPRVLPHLTRVANDNARLVATYLYSAAEHIYADANAPDLALRCIKAARSYCLDPGLRETLIRKQLDLALFARCYDDAYEALLNFPEGDEAGRRHAVLDFIMRLWQDGEAGRLCAYPYVSGTGLGRLVTEALAQLAQGNTEAEADGMSFYDVLYAYHARRGDYKQAATWMLMCDKKLLQQCRIGHDLGAVLEQRARVLSLAANALALVPDPHQWVVDGAMDAAMLESPKRPRDADLPSVRRGKIGGIEDVQGVEQRYMHVVGLKALLGDGVSPDIVMDLDATSTVMLLAEHGRYDMAIAVAVAHKQKKLVERVMEDLAGKCVHSMLAGDVAGAAWLGKNHIPGARGGDDAAWRLLRSHLDQHGYHERVARCILREEVSIPAWLEADMCARNLHAALIHAYLDHARFDRACELLLDYLAVLDRDGDVANEIGLAMEGGASVYPDVSGLVSWQLVARIMAGLHASPDSDRANTLRLRIRGRLEECSGAVWGVNGSSVMRELAAMVPT